MKIKVEVEVPSGEFCFDRQYPCKSYSAIGCCKIFDCTLYYKNGKYIKCPACLKACKESEAASDA